jgi:gluconate kinase
MAARRGHFFPARLLQSQLADLEMPGDGETTLVVSAAARAPAEIADEIMRRLHLAGQPHG